MYLKVVEQKGFADQKRESVNLFFKKSAVFGSVWNVKFDECECVRSSILYANYLLEFDGNSVNDMIT